MTLHTSKCCQVLPDTLISSQLVLKVLKKCFEERNALETFKILVNMS